MELDKTDEKQKMTRPKKSSLMFESDDKQGLQLNVYVFTTY